MTDTALLEQAATVAFAMLRFESDAANTAPFQSRDGPQFGIDQFVFLPVRRVVAREHVVAHLLAQPGRALLIPSSVRGFVVEMLLAELAGARLRAAERQFVEADEALQFAANRWGLTDETAILVEVDATPTVVPFAALRLAFSRWTVYGVAGHLDPLEPALGAAFRLSLLRSDGTASPGAACGVPPGA